MEEGGEVGGPGRSWSCSAWRDHILSMECCRGGQKAQGAVGGGGLSVASVNCCPEVQEVSAGIPEQRFPTMGVLPCVPGDASLPGACMGVSGPCLWLTCSVGGLRVVGNGGPPDLALWVCFPAELLLWVDFFSRQCYKP